MTRSLLGRHRHPRFRTSARWWIVKQSPLRLLALAFVIVAGISLIIAIGILLSEKSPTPVAQRFDRLFVVWLEAMRAVVGTDSYQPQKGNTLQELFSTVAGLIGALLPAAAIGIVIVRVFSVRPFVWRKKASVCLAAECDFGEYAQAHAGSDKAMLTVRFYNRLHNLSIVDLRCRVYLRYLAPSVDGTLVFHKILIQQLDGSGTLNEERLWPSLEHGAPFTIWIPLDAACPALPATEIQGTSLIGRTGTRLLVRLTAKAVGINTEVVDERWFDLTTDDVELGRFTPVKPDDRLDVRHWRGWEGFEDVLDPPSEIDRMRMTREPAADPDGDGADVT